MNKFAISKLSITNFKNLRSLEIKPRGNCRIYGDNATGKTTVADAVIWLLFDKDSQWRSSFDIKTLDAHGKAIPMLDHTVAGTFHFGEKEITLSKTYKEKWTKKRGRAKKEFTGHTTTYEIDGVPANKKQYSEKIRNIIAEDVFKLLTSPTYFSEQLAWEKRRELLLSVCGDISTKDVIDSDKELAELKDILGDRSIDDQKKVIAAQRKKVNKEIESIPVRIDEITRSAPQRLDDDCIKRDIDALEVERETLQKKIVALENGVRVSQLRVEVAECDAEIKNYQSEYKQQCAADADALDQQARKLGVSKLLDEVESLARKKVEATNLIDELQDKRQELISAFNDTKGKKLKVSEVCITCGQDIDKNLIQEQLKAFNAIKAKNLKSINEKGKAVRQKLDEAEKRLAQLEDDHSAKQQELRAAEDEEKKIKAQVAFLRKQELYVNAEDVKLTHTVALPVAVPVVPKAFYSLVAKKRALSEDINEKSKAVRGKLQKYQKEIDQIGSRINELRNVKAEIKAYKESEKRIEELKFRERELAAEFEELERQMFLLEEYTRKKVSLLESRVNNKFDLVKFKLFDEQINGGLKECCECMIDGVPYPSLNSAARIQSGLDIIKTLSKHHNFYPFIFVDNAESITTIPSMDAQVIELVVSAKDKALRVV